MLFEQTFGSRCPYGPIKLGSLLGGVARCLSDEIVPVEKGLTIPPCMPVFLAGDQPFKIFIHRCGRVLLNSDAGEMQLLDAFPAGPHGIYGLIETLSGEP